MIYLRKFENHTKYEEARQNLILPNVSLCAQDNEVHYNPKKAKKAKLYDYLYSDLTFGSEVKDGIIGVCVIGGGILPDGKARFMSIKGMSPSNPNEGGENYYIYWGGLLTKAFLNNFNKVVTGETSASGSNDNGYLPKNGTYSSSTPYIPSPIDYFDAYSDTVVTTANSLSDFDGKGNTEVLTSLATAQSDWKTANTIANESGTGYYPAACVCWRFIPGNTNQGDWYLPAMGELGFVIVNFDEINNKISAASGIQLNGMGYCWSSTENDSGSAWSLYTSNGYVTNDYKGSYHYVRAFLAL